MNLLLDTHVWIWTQESPQLLGKDARERVSNPANVLYVSTISTLEIARLIEGGDIVLKGTLPAWIRRSTDALRSRTVEISHEIAVAAYALPKGFHRDPADRILVATAKRLNLTLVTADERILAASFLRTLDARK